MQALPSLLNGWFLGDYKTWLRLSSDHTPDVRNNKNRSIWTNVELNYEKCNEQELNGSFLEWGSFWLWFYALHGEGEETVNFQRKVLCFVWLFFSCWSLKHLKNAMHFHYSSLFHVFRPLCLNGVYHQKTKTKIWFSQQQSVNHIDFKIATYHTSYELKKSAVTFSEDSKPNVSALLLVSVHRT